MRIVVVGVYSKSLVAFRGHMLAEMVARGHEVHAMAPEDKPRVRSLLASMGVSFGPVALDRGGLSPLGDARLMVALARVFRRRGAELVFVYGAKPVVYGLLAAGLVGVRQRAAMVTGIGSVLAPTGGWRRRALRRVLRTLYRVALRQAHVVFFQNPDDEQLFRTLGLVAPGQRTVRVNGSGVDLEEFAPTPLPSGPLAFLMIGRLLADKGVREYVNAAREVHRSHPEVRFQLLGPLDERNPSGITRRELDEWIADGSIEYLGKTRDVRPFLAAAHVCVLPSYGEGTPRSVLEAMAMARPIVTTDTPGCRQTVEPGQNGYLVPARDSRALAAALERIVTEPHSIERMGRCSRQLAQERFDVHAVNRVILGALELDAREP